MLPSSITNADLNNWHRTVGILVAKLWIAYRFPRWPVERYWLPGTALVILVGTLLWLRFPVPHHKHQAQEPLIPPLNVEGYGRYIKFDWDTRAPAIVDPTDATLLITDGPYTRKLRLDRGTALYAPVTPEIAATFQVRMKGDDRVLSKSLTVVIPPPIGTAKIPLRMNAAANDSLVPTQVHERGNPRKTLRSKSKLRKRRVRFYDPLL
jgi:hypothetical protein